MMILLLIIASANKFCNIRLVTLRQGPQIMFFVFFNYPLASWHCYSMWSFFQFLMNLKSWLESFMACPIVRNDEQVTQRVLL